MVVGHRGSPVRFVLITTLQATCHREKIDPKNSLTKITSVSSNLIGDPPNLLTQKRASLLELSNHVPANDTIILPHQLKDCIWS